MIHLLAYQDNAGVIMTAPFWTALFGVIICICCYVGYTSRYFQRWVLKWRILQVVPDRTLADSTPRAPSLHTPKSVAFTCTTHRRLHSFIASFQSFLDHCSDREFFVREYIIVDDGSSDADRCAMRSCFPFCQFIFKNQCEQGHPRSINMIMDAVKTPLWLQWEDDWVLPANTPLIGRALSVMHAEQRAMQVSVNGGWHDTTMGRSGSVRNELGRISYTLVEYPPACKERLTPSVVARGACREGDPPWPLFSLQPGLNRMAYFQALGKVTEDWRANMQPRYFVWELEYAVRYVLGGASKASISQMPYACEVPNNVSVSGYK